LRRLIIVASFAFALALPCEALALAPLRIAWLPSTPRNYTPANRPAWAIRTIVIHVTEGSYLGSIQWLRNPRSRASSHYVVSQRGEIAQLVRDDDIAWHAGNYLINRNSIGIEHEGWTWRPGTITDSEYRSSARLSAYLARRYVMPINRSRFIGHADVPDPNNPGKRGGFSHHMDPGPYWDWNRYLAYVRGYARGATRPSYVGAQPPARTRVAAPRKVTTPARAKALTVSTATLRNGQSVGGFVRWEAAVSKKDVRRVDFLVDGRLRHTETKAPYVFGNRGLWDTTRETNGTHVLTLRVVDRNGRVVGASTRVTVVNMAFQLEVSGVANGQSVSGRVRVEAVPTGAPADRIDFLVDDRLRHTEREQPFELDSWDTTKEANGAHTITVRGVAEDGRVATAQVTVLVANAAPPRPQPQILSQTLADGQRLSGKVRWRVEAAGRRIERVEFWIDGVRRWMDFSRPYDFNGDGRWDTRTEQNGSHVILVRVVQVDGEDVDTFFTVVVSNTPPPPIRVTDLSLPDGATVTGRIKVDAKVEGVPDRVEFWVDGSRRHVERSAPYEFDWDTARVGAGRHTLTVKAGDAERTITVHVAPPQAPTIVITGLSLADGATVSGRLTVVATVQGKPERVDFWVDGSRRHTERSAPYEFDWDTSRVGAGRHTLTVKAGGAERTIAVTVAAPQASPIAITGLSLADGATITGRLTVVATVQGKPDRVEFWVDGSRRHTETSAPYEFDWDTARVGVGPHTLTVKAGTAERTIGVTVAAAAPPAPPAPAPPKITAVSLADGATVSGTVQVEATVEGQPAQVEFWVDGSLRHTEQSAPYEFEWDVSTETAGAHTLTVKAGAAEQTITVTVAGAGTPEVRITEVSVADGATLTGTVHVEATVEGEPEQVEFWIDGELRRTQQGAPYEFEWDTATEDAGPHTLTVKAGEAEVTVNVMIETG
jgi:N-acetyl-anhydromuramyl-L-alanine amidase AmpD